MSEIAKKEEPRTEGQLKYYFGQQCEPMRVFFGYEFNRTLLKIWPDLRPGTAMHELNKQSYFRDKPHVTYAQYKTKGGFFKFIDYVKTIQRGYGIPVSDDSEIRQ